MGREARPSLDSRGSRRSRRGGQSSNSSLEQLRRQFAKFRREHPPHTRIPIALRLTALTAMQHGMTRTQLLRICGVSSHQLDQWEQRHVELSAHADVGVPDARVFSVVGDMSTGNADTADGNRDQELELRLGGWSICVRQSGA